MNVNHSKDCLETSKLLNWKEKLVGNEASAWILSAGLWCDLARLSSVTSSSDDMSTVKRVSFR